MFRSLSDRLSATLARVTGRGRITEENIQETVREIRMALLEADVALPVAKAFIDRVRGRALGEEVARSLNPGQAFVKIVHDELVAVLGGSTAEIARTANPTVIMLVGLQGAGKTTTAAKLAGHLAGARRDDVLMVSTDVHRPAARQQLAKLGADLGMPVASSESDSPVEIARAALAEARRDKRRWLIVDMAGRLHIDAELMDEAKAVHAAVSPHETLFVLDAMAGQDAVTSARAFHETLPLGGVIATKVDGDARGGAILSVREVTGLPIKLLGTGEKLDALEAFDPERMASRILGMGDVVGLVESVQRNVDQDAAERMAKKVKRGRRLNLEDFRTQLEQLRNMGDMGSLLEKIPGVNAAAAAQAGIDERQIRRQIGIIDSMTPAERRRPELINGSRKRRIANGAGLQIQDVNRLLKQHRQLAKTMKRVGKGGMERLLGGLQVPQGRPPPGRRR
ncbi:MAG: signal recognition particle protein [Candidatus Rariloculaceae bacterium]